MARIRPFRGVRYDPEHVGDVSHVIAPPYDVIDGEQAAALRQRHPCNVTHIDWTADGAGAVDSYAGAARTLRDWLERGCLRRDRRPAVYAYAQSFQTPDGERRRRFGFFCIAAFESDRGAAHPHEHTHAGPLDDRFQLIRSTRANLSPVFGVYSDADDEVLAPVRELEESSPTVTWRDALAVEHALYAVDDPRVVTHVAATMAGRAILIADGHHRYEAALRYRRQLADGGGGDTGSADHVLMFLAAIEDRGLMMLPIHRVLSGLTADEDSRLQVALEAGFARRQCTDARDLRRVLEAPANGVALGLIDRTGAWELRPHLTAIDSGRAPRSGNAGGATEDALLPSEVFQSLLLDEALGATAADPVERGVLAYATDWRQAEQRVLEDGTARAFLMPPVAVQAVARRAARGVRMPPKSTFFYPKIPTGLVFHLFD